MIFPADDREAGLQQDTLLATPQPTPLFAASASACAANLWTSVNGWSVVRVYDDLSSEYRAVKTGAAITDLGAVPRYAMRGRDAGAFLSRLTSAPALTLAPGEGARGLMLRDHGGVIDYADVSCLGEDLFVLATSTPHAHWIDLATRRLDVSVEDISDIVAALGVYGPGASAALQRAGLKLPGEGVATSGILRGVETAARPIRFGPAPGIELVFPKGDALTIWERLSRRAKLRPVGLDALEVLRIEGGIVRPGHDFAMARPHDRNPVFPHHIGLPHLAPIDHGWFCGRRALRAANINYERLWLGLAIDAEQVSRGAPVFIGKREAGTLTSTGWSPDQRRVVAIAEISGLSRGKIEEISVLTQNAGRAEARILDSHERALASAFEKSRLRPTE